jgi:glutathione synthase/RimK-type ligase-like ATP-grasp enzyme
MSAVVAIITAAGVVADVPRREDELLCAALRARGIEAAVLSWLRHRLPPSIRLCVVRSAYDWAIRRDRFLSWVETTARAIPVRNSPQTLRWGSDKAYLFDLAARGIPIVPTTRLPAKSPASVDRLFAEHGCAHLVLKPTVGVAAREVIRVAADEAALGQAHLERLLAVEDVLAQPYFASIESEGELSVVFVAGRVSHALRKVPRVADFRAMFVFGCQETPVALSEAETAIAERVVAALDADVMFGRIDLMRAPEGDLRVSEVELVSPTLYFDHEPTACNRLADAIRDRLREATA